MSTNQLVVLSLLLILSLLLSETQGIRLDKKYFMSHWQHKKASGSALVEKTNGGAGEVILCKDGRCISGKNRKLITIITTSPSTTIPTSKNEMNGENKADPAMSKGEPGNGKDHGEEENLVVNHGKTSGTTSDQHQDFPADMIDMAEMDYSPARRKPPIHN